MLLTNISYYSFSVGILPFCVKIKTLNNPQWGKTTKQREYTGYHYIEESDFPIKFPNNTFFLFVNGSNVSSKKFYDVEWIVIGR